MEFIDQLGSVLYDHPVKFLATLWIYSASMLVGYELLRWLRGRKGPL